MVKLCSQWVWLVDTIRMSQSRLELSCGCCCYLCERKKKKKTFELVSSKVPFELMSTDVTSPKWELSVFTQSPLTMSQNLMVLSFELEANEHTKREREKNEEKQWKQEKREGWGKLWCVPTDDEISIRIENGPRNRRVVAQEGFLQLPCLNVEKADWFIVSSWCNVALQQGLKESESSAVCSE